MIDWGVGYSSSWRMMEVDRATWADLEEVPDVSAMAVERGDGQLVESGTANVTLPIGEDFGERYCRIEMLAEQDGEAERVAVATLLFSPVSDEASHGRADASLEGRSVLAPAADEVLLAGTTVPKGSDGAAEAARLLRGCCHCPIVVDGAFTLDDDVVFAEGTTTIEAVWMLLDAAQWTLMIEGDGTVHVCPKPTTPELDLDLAHASLLGTSVMTDSELWKLPNRYIAIDGDRVAIAVNDDPDDPISVASRGRYVDMVESSPKCVNGETLQAFAERMLSEETRSTCSKSYTREWWPDVYLCSVVRGGIASIGLEGTMRVTQQSIKCGAGALVTETAEVLRWL